MMMVQNRFGWTAQNSLVRPLAPPLQVIGTRRLLDWTLIAVGLVGHIIVGQHIQCLGRLGINKLGKRATEIYILFHFLG